MAFQSAVECQDWKEVLYLLKKTNPKTLSEKTTFFFKYHQKAVRQGLFGEPLASDFYEGIEKSSRCNCFRV